MKFTEAWAGVAQVNVVLKFTVVGLVVANVITAFALTTFALKQPLIFERGEATKSVKLTNPAATKEEVEKFVRIALSQRFDSGASLDENLFVAGEIKNRDSESKELDSRNMNQKIIVNRMDVSKESVTVEADRIIKVGEVKTILPFPLTLKIAAVDRTVSNPYGLKVAEVSQIEKKDRDDAK